MTKVIQIGTQMIGGGAPVSIQSMTNTETKDTEKTIAQILRLEEEGCEIVRIAVRDLESADAIPAIRAGIHIPLVADVHFDYRIALRAMEKGADKIRINPGNIGGKDRVQMVADCAKMHHVPIRVGANSGSLQKQFSHLPVAQAMAESALLHIRMLEACHFEDIVVSLKASHAKEMVEANRLMAKKTQYPLHLGVTEAGTLEDSIVKSSMGIGALLLDGVGDTIRVSITGDPVNEIKVAKDILRFAGVRQFGPEIISCPTCGRCRVALEEMVVAVRRRTKNMKVPATIAVMGCAVNGPGEAKQADFGIAGGDGNWVLFQKENLIGTYDAMHVLDALDEKLQEWIKGQK